MSLLVDGYNLLHASGILGRGRGPRGLERSRCALLNFLAESLDERELARTTVVFDAAAAPPGLPRILSHRGMTVRFASPQSSADELIEELIQADSTPRRLTVVSSDHRIQRAAHRRKAHPIDSDQWYSQVVRRRIDRDQLGPPTPTKPTGMPEAHEVRFWLHEFGVEVSDDTAAPSPSSASSVVNPFPPGYGEDVETASEEP